MVEMGLIFNRRKGVRGSISVGKQITGHHISRRTGTRNLFIKLDTVEPSGTHAVSQ